MAICPCNCHKEIDQPCSIRHCCDKIGQQPLQHSIIIAPPYADGLLSPKRGVKEHYLEDNSAAVDNGWMGATINTPSGNPDDIPSQSGHPGKEFLDSDPFGDSPRHPI